MSGNEGLDSGERRAERLGREGGSVDGGLLGLWWEERERQGGKREGRRRTRRTHSRANSQSYTNQNQSSNAEEVSSSCEIFENLIRLKRKVVKNARFS